MEPTTKLTRYATHPLLLIAAIAVVLFCGVGIAAIMGWLPNSGARMGPPVVAEAPVQIGQADGAPPPPPPAYAANTAPAGPAGPGSAGLVSGASGGGSYGGGYAEAPRAPEAAPRAAEAPPRPAVCKSCGVVESVRTVTQRGEGSGLGAAGGAIIGGLLGNQIGGGDGRKLATAAGAVGGAVVGNQVEGNMKATRHYEVRVRMENGKYRTVTSTSANWEAGDRVKVVNGRLQRR